MKISNNVFASFIFEWPSHEAMVMEWSDLRIFLAIAREGTLGGAARRLKQSQPTMGRRLRALELDTGQKLFQRTAEGYVLTDEGAAVLKYAERMEEDALSIERTLAGREQQLDGVLRVTSSDWFGAYVLVPILAEFASEHPQVTIELLTDARPLDLSRREADLAFRILPFLDAGVVSRKLLSIPYDLYIKQGQAHPDAGDGQGAPLITLDAALANLPEMDWLKRMLPNASIVFRSNAREIQARMCTCGVGMAVLPRPLGDAVEGIERVDLGEAPPMIETRMGYHQDMRRLARLRALIDLVVARLAT